MTYFYRLQFCEAFTRAFFLTRAKIHMKASHISSTARCRTRNDFNGDIVVGQLAESRSPALHITSLVLCQS